MRNSAIYPGILRCLQPVYSLTRQIGDQIFCIGLAKGWRELRKYCKNQYLALRVSSNVYLETSKHKPSSNNSEVLQFCQQLWEIFKKSIENGKLDFAQARWFLQGLPPSIQSELFNRHDVDLDGETTLEFEDILRKACSFIESGTPDHFPMDFKPFRSHGK